MSVFEVILYCALLGSVFALSAYITTSVLKHIMGERLYLDHGGRRHYIRRKSSESKEGAAERLREKLRKTGIIE